MDPFIILGRVFKNEPLERTMYMIVIWVMLLVFSPDSWPAHVDMKVGIPHIWHVFIFALSFSVAINAQRLISVCWRAYQKRAKALRETQRRKHANKIISDFTDEQKMVLCVALNEMKQLVITSQVFPHIQELIQLGVLNPKHTIWRNKYLAFPIDDLFWNELIIRWDANSIDIRPQ